MNHALAGSLGLTSLVLAGCMACGMSKPEAKAVSAKGPQDGELMFPAGYPSWPVFLSHVQRPDAKQVRDLYINPTGANVPDGQPFPNGTTMVMELYNAKLDGDRPVTASDGTIVKGELAKVFVMQKGEGWGQSGSIPLRNGNWAFSAFGPDGKPVAEDFSKCRACHAPVAGKDFTHRLDEYLQQREKR